MKIFILTLVLLFSCSLAFAGFVEVGGFYTPVTKSFSGADQASGTIVWQPASGKRIVLMGIAETCLGDASSTARLGTGIDSSGNGTFIDVIPMVNIASGPIIITSGVPIWEGAVDGTLAVTTNQSFTATLTLWGYEH